MSPGKLSRFPVPPMPKPLVDVCVLGYNQADITLRCLDHLSKVDAGVPVKYWFLNNGSPDKRVARAFDWMRRNCSRLGFGRYRGFPAKFFEAEENMNFSGGNNWLSKRGSAPWLCFLNDDAFPTSGWLKGLVEAAAANSYAAVGPVSNRVIGVQSVKFNASLLSLPDVHMAQMLSGFCVLVRRDVFEEVGGWDEQFVNGDEDLDLSVRIRRAGYTLGVNRSVFVEHQCSASLEPWAKANGKTLQQHFSGTRRLLLDKHGERVQNDLWFWEHLSAPKSQWSKMGVLPNGYFFYPPGGSGAQARALAATGAGIFPAYKLCTGPLKSPKNRKAWSCELHPRSQAGRGAFFYHIGRCKGGGLSVRVSRGGLCCSEPGSIGDDRSVSCETCEASKKAEEVLEGIVDGLHVQQHSRLPLRQNGGNGRVH